MSSILNYFESKNVKVFPCTYRGTYENTDGDAVTEYKAFDPESRLISEYNYTNLPGIVAGKKSYIIDYLENPSEDIDNSENLETPEDLENPDNSETPEIPETPMKTGTLKCVINGYYFEIYNLSLSKNLILYINEATAPITSDSYDSSRTLQYLSKVSSTQTQSTTEFCLDVKDNDTYKFHGLGYTNGDSDLLNSTDKVYTSHLKVSDGNGNIIFSENIRNFGILYSGTDKDKTARRLSLDNEASGKNSFAAGEGTKATKDNQTVVGQYNDESDALFAVGAGDKDDVRKNALEVYSDKVVVPNGNIEANEFIGVATRATNDSEGNKIVDTYATESELSGVRDDFNERLGDISTALGYIINIQNSLIGRVRN